MSVYDWTEETTEELGQDLAATIYKAHDEALLVEVAQWMNQWATQETRQALLFLAERVEVTP